MENLKNQNFQTIQKSVNLVRDTAKSTPQLTKLLYSPQSLYVNAGHGEVDFQFLEKKPSEHQNMVWAFAEANPDKKNKLHGVIDFDIDLNKPLLSIFSGAKALNLESAALAMQRDIIQLFKDLPNDKQSDKMVQQSFLTTSKTLDDVIQKLHTNGDFKFKQKDESLLLNFVLAHELAHLSFKDREKIQFQYMDQAKLPNSEAQKYLSNALLNLNHYFGDWRVNQHESANYKSSRDEIHSDVVGMFTMTYLALRDKTHTEQELKSVLSEFGTLRKNMNMVTSIHGVSSHNSDVLFEPNFVNRIMDLAKQQLKNPNLDAYAATLDVTEDAFFTMIKNKGLVIKNAFEVDTEMVQSIQNGTSGLNSRSVYEFSMKNSNEQSKQTFERCANKSNPVYRDACKHYLNGAHQMAIDPNNDGIVDYRNVNQALVKANGTVFPKIASNNPQDIENNVSKIEAQVMADFAELNNISVKTTNHLGSDLIELTKNSASIKFKK